LCIDLWKPEADLKPKPPRPTSLNKRMVTFLRDLPTSEEQWLEERKKTRLSTAAEILHAVDCLVNGQLDSDPVAGNVANHGLQYALSSSAKTAGRMVATATNYTSIAHFFSLVFLAECEVAIVTGQPKSSVYLAVRTFIKASGRVCKGEKVPELYLSTIRWVLQEQQRQFKRGLLHRAFELFFNKGNDIQFYTRCPKDSELNDVFTAKFPLPEENDEGVREVPDEIHASLPLWIPFIVKLRAGELWSYKTICNALKVDLLCQDEDFGRFEAIYLSRILVARRLPNELSPQPLDKPEKRRRRAAKRKRQSRPDSLKLRPEPARE
ncbi:hypothetical protein B0T19DRAFT_342370, partial [Cercophora scortea]